MRKYGKWLLVLGILAANPAWVSADGFLDGLRPQSRTAERQANQQKAEQVAQALKQARLNGYDLEVEVRGDIVKLDGKVRDVTHRALAERVSKQVTGINRIQNNLKYVPSGNIQQTAAKYTDNSLRPATYNVVEGAERSVEQVHFQKPGKRTSTAKKPTYRPQRTVTKRPSAPKAAEPWAAPKAVAPAPAPPVAAKPTPKEKPIVQTTASVPAPTIPAAPAGPNNQEVAQNIANSIEQVGVEGYNIVIRYENGVAKLEGDVPSANQVQAAGFAASKVPGVGKVQNDLKVSSPIAQTAFNGTAQMHPAQMAPAPMGQVYPASMMMAPGMNPGMGGPTPSPIAGAGNYSNPQLPQHAWPAYAQYPNSAAVQYPKQHSASAFPYIGPFYPYPQVPLGWREVSLQWDDGYWQLDFEEKHDAWYWLWNPKNWIGED